MAGFEPQPPRELEPVETGQPDIEQDEVRVMGRDAAEAGLAVVLGVDTVPLRFEEPAEEHPVGLVVLDHEDDGGRLDTGQTGPPPVAVHVSLPTRRLGTEARPIQSCASGNAKARKYQSVRVCDGGPARAGLPSR